MTRLRQIIHTVYPWIVIFFCALFLFYKYILQVSPSVMTNQLMQSFHIHAAGLGNLAATFFYSYLIVQLFAGPLLDKYSARNLMSSAIFMAAFGTLVFAMANDIWIAAIGRMLVGVGAAFATVGYMKMASVYFPPKQFALVGGFLATAAMIGAVLGETPLAYMVHIFGWQHSLIYIGASGFAIAALFFLVVQDKKDSGFLDAQTTGGLHLTKKDFLTILKKRHNWLLALYSGMAFAPVAVFGGLWGNPFLQTVYHTTKIQTANLISLVFIGLAVGGPVLGFISDRLRNRLGVMFVGSLLSLATLLVVIYIPLSRQILMLLLFTFGFGTGAFMLGFAAAKDINPPMLAATVIALINTGDAIFGAVTEPFVGKLLDVLWHGKMVDDVPSYTVATYQHALSVLIVYLFLTLIIIFFIKREAGRAI